MSGRPRVVAITGPTATGKSGSALVLAHRLEDEGIRPEVISMDSIQVYRGMDIGTDKLMPDQREGVPHHLIDVADPDETFSAAEFSRRARKIVFDSWESGGAAILAGGTGFYLRAFREKLFSGPAANEEIRGRIGREMEEKGSEALHEKLRGIDPESARNIHPNDRVRIIRALEVYEVTGLTMTEHFKKQKEEDPGFDLLVIGLSMEREKMYEKINTRVDQMIGQGLIDEVKALRQAGYGRDLSSQHALGYKEVHSMLDGEMDQEETVYLIKRNTRRFAKGQLTWFRKEPGLVWMDAKDPEVLADRAIKFIKGETPQVD